MDIDWEKVTQTVADTVADWPPVLRVGVPILTALLAVALAIYLVHTSIKAVQDAVRNRTFDMKLEIGFTAVQAVVTYEIMDGVYDFFRRVVGNPHPQSVVMAVFFEGAVWTSVGFILVHGRTRVPKIDKEGNPVLDAGGNAVMVNQLGWGLGGPFFWIFTVSGGLLAIIGAGGDLGLASGRTIIVVFGASLWVLRLMFKTHRNTRRSRFAFNPRRMMERYGWIEPEPDETQDENREWRVAQLAKAIRMSNGNRWERWRGGRALVRLAESTDEGIMREAQMRCAQVYVLKDQASYGSVTMAAAIRAVQETSTAIATLNQEVALRAARAAAGQVAVSAGHAGRALPEAPAATDADEERPAQASFAPPAPRTGGQVRSLATKREEDQRCAETILMIVEREMTKKTGQTVRYDSWDAVRTAIKENPDVISINKIETLSKTTACPMGKPKITQRILPNAEDLHPLPGDVEVSKAG